MCVFNAAQPGFRGPPPARQVPRQGRWQRCEDSDREILGHMESALEERGVAYEPLPGDKRVIGGSESGDAAM